MSNQDVARLVEKVGASQITKDGEEHYFVVAPLGLISPPLSSISEARALATLSNAIQSYPLNPLLDAIQEGLRGSLP